MKITFPHLGNTYLAAKALFDGLGIECIIPPFSSNEALGARFKVFSRRNVLTL